MVTTDDSSWPHEDLFRCVDNGDSLSIISAVTESTFTLSGDDLALTQDPQDGKDDSITRPTPLIKDAKWMKHYHDLTLFASRYGTCLVPRNYDQNPSLGQWVNNQRRKMRQWDTNNCSSSSKLNKQMIMLTDIGFKSCIGTGQAAKVNGALLSPRHVNKWEEMYASLLEYRKDKGHADVPTKSKEFPSLGRWVTKQRNMYNVLHDAQKGSTILEARFKRLKDVEFNFSIGSGN